MNFGGTRIILMAGPCAVESREQMLYTAEYLQKLGVDVLRGGIYKPRSNPIAFQGLKEQGVNILAEARQILPVVSEATQVDNVATVSQVSDIIQIGSRNMHNAGLLKEASRTGKPILLKRGYAARIEDEWIMAAKYISREGNENIIMCERGIRTFEPYTRNTLDLAAIGAIKELTPYPIIIDPSHAAGKPELVIPFALAAIAAGADGLIIEVHNDPQNARCDGHQSLTLEQFAEAVPRMQRVAESVERVIARG